jgi:hypothetical protein
MAPYHERTFGAGRVSFDVIETVETPKAVVAGAATPLPYFPASISLKASNSLKRIWPS